MESIIRGELDKWGPVIQQANIEGEHQGVSEAAPIVIIGKQVR